MSTHHVDECKHGKVVGQCRCRAKDKAVRIVPCPPSCPADECDNGATAPALIGNLRRVFEAVSSAPLGPAYDIVSPTEYRAREAAASATTAEWFVDDAGLNDG